MTSTIFVQIASYRDRELLPTLRDCVARAAHPDALRFGICWQWAEDETIGEFLHDPRFRIIAVPHRDSRGACWARNALQSLYDGETYTLQLDSHHRFTAGWDVTLIEMLRGVPSAKPLLTTYAPAYDPVTGIAEAMPWLIAFDRFSSDGLVLTRPRRPAFELTGPVPARFYSAHFAFTLGRFCEEVKHDPSLYFQGEEITIAVRAYTHGYDLFHPHRAVVWHEYTRRGRPKHWDDHTDGNVRTPWHSRDAISRQRALALMGAARPLDLGGFGLGTTRRLDEYQRYAGIDFARRLVQRYTLEDRPPPNPQAHDLDEWRSPGDRDFETLIVLDHGSLPSAAEIDFWYVGVHDAWRNELFRRDLEPARVRALMRERAPRFTFSYRAPRPAETWTVWPHSPERGWLQKLTGRAAVL